VSGCWPKIQASEGFYHKGEYQAAAFSRHKDFRFHLKNSNNMNHLSFLRGMATVSFYADDVKAARKWYADLLGITPYFERPDSENPAYIEFRLGDYQHELGIIDRKYAPTSMKNSPGGAVIFWHVDNIQGALEKVKAMGATEYEPLVNREAGFVTASVIDPFGNILGLMYNPHYLEILNSLHNEKQSVAV
jgi:predicted enzyme related to lactoylglutathione lyase